ncbi:MULTISPECIES: pyridoxine 5'-phosphate synthase [Methylobacterium]|jgi:pyridoxine 5-phosphate synthase|uniref:Pyridoxine 5'-phosphate synthase n=1 Tax=Methylobacterium isbiliense TaxID=315478 RepID=A0ABQ4SAR2_9HYPH|nr:MULTISPECIES: pyridoxine 5'-phosphate synthase [Methylobacterium]MBY0296711.1 pyridoxine 5'-phosphate synthase [Methylobacterium sp.]MDN3625006.1 pyridoxine 5'-phosphate synthase [Methylobacterium isbiliense]GJD98883.1 Pyridoxine 5'-phosphate synthase [Methylobacterium isbiliense]
MPASSLRLGVNIDHIATLRNARGGVMPDPLRAAHAAVAAGADGITAHLREDRRHIRDVDVERLKAEIDRPLNLEMATTDEMIAIAVRLKPHAACLVPERREERTTEGGLDIVGARETVGPAVARLGEAGIRVSLFVEPDVHIMDAARQLGAPVVELHTGRYCEAVAAGETEEARRELARIARAAAHGSALGLEVHAGHGLTLDSVGPVAAVPQIRELNIGHAIVAEAVFVGFGEAVRAMRAAMDAARAEAAA